MKDLTIIVLGNFDKISEDKNIEIRYSNGTNINELINKAKGKYITFIKEEDKITKDYLEKVISKTKEDFDSCFINYIIEYNYKNELKICKNKNELAHNKPYYGEYLWSFIFKKNKLKKMIEMSESIDFDNQVDNEFVKTTAIETIIYYHNPRGKRLIKMMPYSDIKRNEYYKNIIYLGNSANGTFNGYISWVKNLGRCFSKKYDITILYDNITSVTYSSFSKYFKCIKRCNSINYVCDGLSVTYSTYFYPKNIFTLDENFMFIHGNMSDYPNSRKFYDDIYSHYIAVSKIAAKKAVGYFPTKKIESIINPFKLDKELLKPHLKLTSAFRYSDVKRPDRVEKIAHILNALDIPYTWNLFTDKKENTNDFGLIYRKRVTNPIPYIQDSDYFVHLSDSEAMPYCILEALAVNTKVVVTPLEAYEELKIKDGENGYIIPFEYFEKGNEDKLIEIVKKMYENKKMKCSYKINEKLWNDYNYVFKK